jgi:hypothetical protein
LQEVPALLQFRPVDLGPRLDQALLRLRQAAPEALDRIDGKHGRMFLEIRVEMRSMMLPPASTNMRMTIPKKREISGTNELYIVRLWPG